VVWKERARWKKKSNLEVQKKRWAVDKPQRFQNATFMNKKTGKIQRQLSENDKNPVVLKLSFGEIVVRGANMDSSNPFCSEISNSDSNKVPSCPYVPVCRLKRKKSTSFCCSQYRKF